MGKDSKGHQQDIHEVRQYQSAEEIRRKARETLEKANRLLAESGLHLDARNHEEEEKP